MSYPIRWDVCMSQDSMGRYVSYHDYAMKSEECDSLRARVAELEAELAKREAWAAELRAIRDASPKAWELPIVEFCEEFRVWAQSRAREALAKLEVKP